MTEYEMVAWRHQLNGHEFEQTLGDSEGQGSLVCCSLWGHKELDTAQQLNNEKQCNGKPVLSIQRAKMHCGPLTFL